MKYDSGMTHFHKDIAKALLRRLKVDSKLEKLVSDGDAKPLREYLKDTFKLSGYSSPDEPFSVWCSATHIEITYKNKILASDGDRKLQLSYSQLATLLRNGGFYGKYIRTTERNNETMTESKRMSPADGRYLEALNLNNRIIVAAQLAQQNLYDMCMGFKKMRDDKLYKELGYSDFGEYCEKETGFKRSQVYNYIAVAEKLPSDFVHSSGQIGIKKMTLLSTLSEEDRTEITATTDLESTTVKELERQIKELKAQEEKSLESFNRVANQSKANFQKYLEEKHKREDLAVRCKELENRPVEVATQIVEKIPDNYITPEAYEKMVADYTEQLEKADEDFIAEKRRAYAEKEELEKKIAELENAPHESDGKEMFAMLCQMCRHPLSKLALFVCDRPGYKNKFKEFLAETTEIIDKEN